MNQNEPNSNLNGSDFSNIKNLKPGLKNVSLHGVIVEFISDPPQSTTELRNYRYHYKLADSSGSITLAVPHGILMDTISKLTSYVSLTSGHNASKVEQYLFSKIPVLDLDSAPGFTIKEVQPTQSNSTKGEMKYIDSEFDEDSDWNGWSDDEESKRESLKWLLQPGDVIYIPSALTTWSHGQMVLVPNETKNESLTKIGKFQTQLKMEPDMSKQFTGSKE
ncbi:uncharacterized protein TA15735 [Theileria annulata]|uniref:Uncharacterized protein n=1 Tax=Theileria annulata TaxID=5874 RepID=Q4UFN2_THEAN|nr:uncharacterized protein TA15735 [Theileria annulata]CAI74084.1 hypothetical protein TA15735 [Theileria annulata]|eukprot:XP_951816.1 hypothetical protein TA15735 [Theileria annulata]